MSPRDTVSTENDPDNVPPTNDGKYRGLIRAVFIIIPFVFLAQGAFGDRFEEPYPSLTLPGFSTWGQTDEGQFLAYNVDVVCIFEGGDREILSPVYFVRPAPRSHFSSLMRWFLPPSDDTRPIDDRDTPPPLEQVAPPWLHRVAPGLHLREDNHYTERADASMHQWLIDRSDELFPDRTTVRIEFHWYFLVLEQTEEGIQKNRADDEVFVVSLSR